MPRKLVIEAPDITPYEAVDVTASLMLKEPHRRFGDWMKRVASIVKEVLGEDRVKGQWQPYWTIATRVFGLVYRGHSKEVCATLARALAEEMQVDPGLAERIAEKIYDNKQEIIGGAKARPTVSE